MFYFSYFHIAFFDSYYLFYIYFLKLNFLFYYFLICFICFCYYHFENKIHLFHWAFSQKKISTWISSQFYDDPLEFSTFFALTPLEILVFPSNFDISWNSNYFHSTPFEISIDILNKGISIYFFLEKPIIRKRMIVLV